MGVTLYCIAPLLPNRVLTADQVNVVSSDGKKLVEMLSVIRMVPSFPAPRAILHVPEQVERAYREGEVNRAEKRYLSAAGNYRTALDRALKSIAPDDKGTIYQKVEHLALQNALPRALIDLMHEIRFLGNQIHDMDDPDPADVEAGADFATLLLTYLFELPGRVAATAAKREAAKRVG